MRVGSEVRLLGIGGVCDDVFAHFLKQRVWGVLGRMVGSMMPR